MSYAYYLYQEIIYFIINDSLISLKASNKGVLHLALWIKDERNCAGSILI